MTDAVKPIEEFEPPTQTLARLPDESILDYTQRVRANIVENLVQGGALTDEKAAIKLNMVLDSMDKQEISKKKLVIDEEAGKQDQLALGIIQGILDNVGNDNPYLAENIRPREVRAENAIIEGVTFVPGEFDDTPRDLNYDSFMKEYEAKNPRQKPDDA